MRQIRREISECDGYAYLISRNSVGEGRYIHSELAQIKKKWPKPWGKVLPVVIENDVELDELEPYLAMASLLRIKGNAAAEAAAAVREMFENSKIESASNGLTLKGSETPDSDSQSRNSKLPCLQQ